MIRARNTFALSPARACARHSRTLSIATICCASLFLPSALTSAQSTAAPPALTPVEVGQDINPLAVGLRPQRVDLRGPSGFDRLYRVAPGTVIGGVAIREGGFARISGSTVVVFPRGQYSRVANGIARADVPPGTMYLQADNISELIGSPQDRADGSRTAPTSGVTVRRPLIGQAAPSTSAPMPRALNARVGSVGETVGEVAASSMQPSTTAVVSSAMSAMPSLWTDESYRQRRVAAIIDAAFAAVQASASQK